MIRRSFTFIATQNICLSSAINASYQSVAHRPRLKFGIVWIRIAIFTRFWIIYLSVVFYLEYPYVEYPFETSVSWSNCSESLSSLVETRKMTANIFGHFFLSPLAFGFIVLLLLPTKRNETKRKETKRDTKRNATNWNSNWKSNLNLNSSEAFVINSKIHTPCRAESRALTAEDCGRGKRRQWDVRWGKMLCCRLLLSLSLAVLAANVILFKH